MNTMHDDELAEINTTEDEIDAMIAEGEPVEVTGPYDPARRVQFELIEGSLHTYRWRLIAANGEILATSTNIYRSHDDAYHAVTTLATALQNAPIIDTDTHAHRKAS